MENFVKDGDDDHQSDQIDLPPGFRFHPTDEELITHYLSQKVLDSRFSAIAIGEADLNKSEPWDLPWRAKMGEKQWYFFCVRDRKYPTGLRTNRATEAGYWKATGKDKEIYRGNKTLVGMKKTLVFYQGRAPKGVKSNWVMHEYRLEGKYSLFNLSKTSKNEWVICRVFEKGSNGKKLYVSSGLVRLECSGDKLMGSSSSLLPPLMDSSSVPYKNKESLRAIKGETSHVTCFSNSMEDKKDEETMIDCFTSFTNPNPNPNPNPCDDHHLHHQSNSFIFSKISHVPNNNSDYSNQSLSNMANFQYPSSVVSVQDDQDVFRDFVESQGSVMKLQSCKAEREVFSISQETGLSTDINTEISSVLSNHDMGIHSFDEEQEVPSTSAGPVDLGCLWSY